MLEMPPKDFATSVEAAEKMWPNIYYLKERLLQTVPSVAIGQEVCNSKETTEYNHMNHERNQKALLSDEYAMAWPDKLNKISEEYYPSRSHSHEITSKNKPVNKYPKAYLI